MYSTPKYVAKAWLGIKLIFLAGIIFFSYSYLVRDHDRVMRFYFKLNSCFYKAADWHASVFTYPVKAIGNICCICAIIISILGIIYYLRKPVRQNEGSAFFIIGWRDALCIVLLLIMAVALQQWASGLEHWAYDEVFSARNIAGIHPFQTMSYYMLPNNHILFNLINNLLFHTATDKVHTGRIISLFGYCVLGITFFYWFKGVMKHRLVALIATVVVMAQFPTWIFAAQARGYELYNLFEVGMVISLLAYLRSSDTCWLTINALCCVAGYYCIPTFFYFHVAQLLFMVIYQLIYREWQLAFWKYQLISCLTVFLLYLPAICFSGLDSLIANRYVTPGTTSTAEYFKTDFLDKVNFFIDHFFSDVHIGHFSLNLILFLLPLTLLFNKNKTFRLMGLFYIVMWVAFSGIAIHMRRSPFERNMIGHYTLTLALLLLAVYQLFSFKTGALLRNALFSIAGILLLVHFIRTEKAMIADNCPYSYDVNQRYKLVSDGLASIPPCSTLFCDDEGFYCSYICQKNGCIIHKCSTGDEQYFIKQQDEPPLPAYANYKLVKKVEDYEVYERK